MPVASGSVFTPTVMEVGAAPFTVGPGGGTLEGAWTAYDGWGNAGLVLENATESKPPPPPGPIMCPLLHSWSEQSGSLSTVLAAGPYSVYGDTFCVGASRIVLPQTLQGTPA